MGDEKESWKVKTLDEILQEKKRRKEQEEKADTKRLKNVSLGFCIGKFSFPRFAQQFFFLIIMGFSSFGKKYAYCVSSFQSYDNSQPFSLSLFKLMRALSRKPK